MFHISPTIECKISLQRYFIVRSELVPAFFDTDFGDKNKGDSIRMLALDFCTVIDRCWWQNGRKTDFVIGLKVQFCEKISAKYVSSISRIVPSLRRFGPSLAPYVDDIYPLTLFVFWGK